MNPSASLVQKELLSLHASPLPNIQIQSSDDLSSLSFLLSGPSSTPFQSGTFLLTITIPPNYPSHPPTCAFKTRIFHPNIHPNSGQVCVNVLKKDWQNQGLRHVLLTINCLLIEPNAESALNEEAGRMLLEDFKGWWERAELMTRIHAGGGNENEQRKENVDKVKKKKSLKRL